MSTLTGQVDLPLYARVARRMYSPVTGLVLLDHEGQVLHSSDEQSAAAVAQTIKRGSTVLPSRERPRYTARPDGNSLLAVDLRVGPEPAERALVVCLEGRPGVEMGPARADLMDTAALVCACVVRDLQLNSEMDDIAGELAARYEELNLVYHTNDQASLIHEGEAALGELVRNCVEYLGVAAAILILGDKRVEMSASTTLDRDALASASQAARTYLYDAAVRAADVVITVAADGAGGQPAAPERFKFLSQPMQAPGGAVKGTLTLVNRAASPDFTNSDRNLCAVMARRAIKIIQGGYDDLTGLVNRRSFEHLVRTALDGPGEDLEPDCLVHINIDQLHRVNDTLGLDAGDAVIRRTAAIVADALRERESAGRIGGDELGILLPGSDSAQAVERAQEILRRVSEEIIDWHGETIRWTASAGVARCDRASHRVDDVMQRAAIACTTSRERGGNRATSYDTDDTAVVRHEEHMWTIARVQSALREDGFLLYGQPIVPIGGSGPPHVEVLLRMSSAHGDPLPPARFLPACERYNLMAEIDRWVIRRALRELALQHLPAGTVLAINLSGQSINESGIADEILEAVQAAGVAPDLLCLEVTETVAVANLDRARMFMEQLSARGIRFALDDFGAGMSSFGYLRALPVHYLKIDGSLVREIGKDPVSAAMVESINHIGHLMNLQTIGEFVETDALRLKLQQMGVDYAQGFALGKPQPLSRLLASLQSECLDHTG